MGQRFFESDDDYRVRMTQEANERIIEQSGGEAPTQRFFESEDDYRSRISLEASERIIEDSDGTAPSQRFFESVDDYRSRISLEANERIIEDSSGSAPSQGFFENDADYRSRLRQEAHERVIEDATGAAPSQRWFEGQGEYRQRTILEAREARANAGTPESGSAVFEGPTSYDSGSSTSSSPGSTASTGDSSVQEEAELKKIRDFSKFLSFYWWYLVPTLSSLVTLALVAGQTPQARLQWGHVLLLVPYVNWLIVGMLGLLATDGSRPYLLSAIAGFVLIGILIRSLQPRASTSAMNPSGRSQAIANGVGVLVGIVVLAVAIENYHLAEMLADRMSAVLSPWYRSLDSGAQFLMILLMIFALPIELALLVLFLTWPAGAAITAGLLARRLIILVTPK